MPWIERVRTEQPLDASVGIDWGNPITRGLDSWLLPTSSGFLTDSGVVPPTVSSSRNRRMTPAGCGAWISGDDGQTGGWTSKNYSLKTDKISQILVVIPTGASAGQITQLRDSGGNTNHAIYGDAGGTVTGAGLGFASLTSTSTMAVGATSVIALNIQNNVSQKLYLNGTLEASSLDTTGGYTPNGGAWLLSGYASVVPWTTGSVLLHLIFTRLLSDGEVKSLYDNPWQVFEKERVWVPVPVDTRPKTYIERVRTSQPLDAGVGIDASLLPAGAGGFSLITGVSRYLNGNGTKTTERHGSLWTTAGVGAFGPLIDCSAHAATGLILTPYKTDAFSGPVTLLCAFKSIAASGTIFSRWNVLGTTASYGGMWALEKSTTSLIFRWNDGSGTLRSRTITGVTLATQSSHVVCMTLAKGSASVFFDGALVDAFSYTVPSLGAATYGVGLTVGTSSGANDGFTGGVYLATALPGVAYDGVSLSANPWQIFAKERIWVPAPIDARPKTYIERVRTSQPLDAGVGIDWSNKFGAALVTGVLGNLGVGISATGRLTTISAGASNDGNLLSFSGTAGNKVDIGPVLLSGPMSIASLSRKTTGHSFNTAIFDTKGFTDWSNPPGFAFVVRSDGGVLFNIGTAETYTTTALFQDAKFHTASAIFKPGVSQDFYIDGVKPTYTANAVASGYTNTTTPLKLGTYYDLAGGRSGAQKIAYAFLFSVAFTPAEMQDFHANPWQLFAKERIWVPVASGPTYTLTASSNSLGLSGQSATLAANRNLVSVTGTYYLTGQAATLGINRYLTSTAGSYSLVGQAPTLAFNHKLISNSGSYSLTGNASTLVVNRNLTSATGNYSLTGSASTLAFNRKLSVSSGSYSLTGPTATLTYTPISGITYTLAASSIGFTLTGTAATLALNRKLSSNSGSFALAGTVTTLVFNRKLITSSSTFTASELAAALAFSRKLPATTGAFVTTSIASTLAFNRKLSVATVSFSFTGQAGTLAFNRKLSSNSGTFALTSSSTSLAAMRKLIAASSGYVLSGQTATLTYWYPTGLAYPNLSYGISLPNNNILVSIPPSISLVVSSNQINVVVSNNQINILG